jgi:hypothetical protein
MVLEERRLWPEDGLPLGCFKPKCNNCQVMATCQSGTKGQRCATCKMPVQHSSSNCSRARLCEACVEGSNRCSCVQRKFCGPCSARRGKSCGDCEILPPRCSSTGKSP